MDKYNAYVDLLNAVTGNLAESERLYAENRIGEDGNFIPADSSNNVAIYSLHIIQSAIENAEEAVPAKPKMAIDGTVEDMLKVLKEEVDILDEINSYYSEKDFLNDDNAKGKELHEKLMAAYKEVDAPVKKFYDEMQDLMAEHQEKERKDYEKKDMKVSLAMLDFIDIAEEASNLIYDSVSEDGTTITLTSEQYADVNTKIGDALETLKKAADDEDAVEKEGFTSISSFVMDATSFKTASNTLAASFGDTETLMDAMKALVENYAELIDSYNIAIK